jgi:hypothetical protein
LRGWRILPLEVTITVSVVDYAKSAKMEMRAIFALRMFVPTFAILAQARTCSLKEHRGNQKPGQSATEHGNSLLGGPAVGDWAKNAL